MRTISKKCMENVGLLFKCIYIVHLLLSFNAIVNKTSYTNITLVMTLAFGAVTAVIKLWNWKKLKSFKNFWLLNAFILSYVVSAVLNIQYGIGGSINGFVWLCTQIWILYLVFDNTDVKKEFLIIGNVYIFMVTIVNIINFLMFFSGYAHRSFGEDGTMFMYGFHWGRLWGIYDDPNHGALISLVAVLFAIYAISQAEKTKKKIYYYVTLVFQILYIYWSDSRTGIYSMALVFVLLFFIPRQYKKEKSSIKETVIDVLISIGIAGVLMLATDPIQYVTGEIRSVTMTWITFENADDLSDELEIGRDEESLSSDPTNRRLDIWKSSLEIWSTKPVVGVTYPNITTYAEEELPETYIVNNDQRKFASAHNMVLDVLVSQGVIGITLLMVILASTVVYVIKRFKWIKKEDYWIATVLFAMIAMNIFGSMFLSSIFYINSPESYSFWISAGYLICLIRKGSRSKEVEEIETCISDNGSQSI